MVISEEDFNKRHLKYRLKDEGGYMKKKKKIKKKTKKKKTKKKKR